MGTKICIVAQKLLPLLSKRDFGSAGGAEVQQYFLIQELAKNGFEISLVSYDYGIEIDQMENIAIQTTYNPKSTKNSLFKFYHLMRVLKNIDADVFYHQSGTEGLVAIVAKIKRKKFIQQLPSDNNVKKLKFFGNKDLKNDILRYIDIKFADTVIAQSEFQQNMVLRNFGKSSIIIKNGYPLKPVGTIKKDNPPVILWVGSLNSIKQPHLFVKLAEELPEYSFQMIGGAGHEKDYYLDVLKSEKTVDNLTYQGFVPFHEIDEYFRRAALLVNTSKFEGFPNTFIQAWINYMPVISLNSNPDNILIRNKIGFHSRSFDQMKDDIRCLMNDETLRNQMGKHGREYIEKEHNLETFVNQHITLFKELIS
jgi:glycosyltransferase involved in cell wall biosynthesis